MTDSGANPQKEHGHFSIANGLAEQFAWIQLSGSQWRLLWVILRQTYGWGKKQDRISFTQFERKTGMDRRNIARSLKDMIDRKIVVKNDNSFIVSYGLQKDYTKWKPLSKKHSGQNDNTPLSKMTTKSLSKMTNTKDNKDTIKKKLPPDEISSLISGISKQYDTDLLNQAFEAIASTRKSNRIAESVKLSILQKWEKYPVNQVEAAIRTYIEKDYASQGKDEKYLLGIIRNSNGTGPVPEGRTMNSTGSRLLDNHYRQEGYTII